MENKKARILTVDDDRTALAILAIGIRKAGYAVLQASSAEEALEVIADIQPDLALLDISLPGMSGIELAKRLREQTAIPFMFLSSHRDDEIAREAAQEGAIGYLVKPIDVKQVVSAIEAGLALARVLGRWSNEEATEHAKLEEDRILRRRREADFIGRYAELTDLDMRLKQVQAQVPQSEVTSRDNRRHQARVNIKALDVCVRDLFRILEAYANTEAALAAGSQARIELEKIKSELDCGFPQSEISALLNASQEGIRRMRAIIENLRMDSLLDCSGEWQWSDLHASLDAALEMARDEDDSTVVVYKEYANIPKLECLPTPLNRAFRNLIVNAIHATMHASPGTITLRTGLEHGRKDGRIWVEISDNGCGIGPENHALVFDPFFTTQPVGKALGLGLTASRDIVHKHGGDIQVTSKVGGGSTFRTTLPQRQAPR